MTTKRYATADGMSAYYIGKPPLISVQENGECSIEWAEDDDPNSYYVMTRQFIESYADAHNELMKLKAKLDAIEDVIDTNNTRYRLAETLEEVGRLRNLVDMAILENSRLNEALAHKVSVDE